MGIVETVAIIVIGLGLAVLLVSRTDGWAPSWSAKAERELELPIVRADAFDRARAAVLGLRLLGTARVNETTGTIEARVFGSWRTLGDFVTVQVDEIDAARSRIRIRSRPIFPQRSDFGASRHRVDGLTQTLEAGRP